MATKQRKIEINYRLLQTSCNIEVVGSVPDMSTRLTKLNTLRTIR